MKGILAKKIGMSRIFSDSGERIPLTLLKAGPCTVLEVKEKYLKLGFDDIEEKHTKKPILSWFKKLNIAPKRFIREIPFTDTKNYKIGDDIKAEIFVKRECVDVRGKSIGKGFQGGMKRWHWSGGPASHGSMHHRRIGSNSSSSDPSRTFKGHNMPGHMGDDNVCVQNLEILKVENDIISIKGCVPGKKNNFLVLTHAIKKPVKKDKIIQKVSTKDALKASKRAAKGKLAGK